MIKELCKNCDFFISVRKWPTFREELTHICAYFLVTERKDYVFEITEYDMCECWTERKDND